MVIDQPGVKAQTSTYLTFHRPTQWPGTLFRFGRILSVRRSDAWRPPRDAQTAVSGIFPCHYPRWEAAEGVPAVLVQENVV